MPYLTGRRGRLHARTWHTTAPIGCQVVLVPGLGEHVGLYEAVAPAMTGAGLEVHALDPAGQGLSQGNPLAPLDLAHAVDDAARLLRSVRRLYPGVPTALVGHSFGGLVAYLLAQTVTTAPPPADHLVGVVLSAAPLQPLTLEARGAAAPRFPPTAWGALREAWAETSGLLAEGGVRVPTLLLHGTEDPLVPVEQARRSAEELAHARLIEITGVGHDLLREGDWRQVAAQIADFLIPRARSGIGVPAPVPTGPSDPTPFDLRAEPVDVREAGRARAGKVSDDRGSGSSPQPWSPRRAAAPGRRR